jgi:hypothetical protein
MKKWTQPPTSVEGVDWVVLNLKASPIKKLFKHKSPSKLNVGEAFVNWDSKCGTCKLNILVHVNIHSFIFYHLDALLGFSLM